MCRFYKQQVIDKSREINDDEESVARFFFFVSIFDLHASVELEIIK